jgi:hypothetical protein
MTDTFPKGRNAGQFWTHADYLNYLEAHATMGMMEETWTRDRNSGNSVVMDVFEPEPQEYFIEILRLARLGLELESELDA